LDLSNSERLNCCVSPNAFGGMKKAAGIDPGGLVE